MKALVTGAAGFTAGHLCERLVREGYQVRGLVRNSSRYSEVLQTGFELVTRDLRDSDSFKQAVNGIDIVFPSAALFR